MKGVATLARLQDAAEKAVMSLWIIFWFALVTSGLMLPSGMLWVLNGEPLHWIISNAWIGVPLAIVVLGAFCLISMHWSIVLEEWLVVMNSSLLDAAAVLLGSLSAFVAYGVEVGRVKTGLSKVPIKTIEDGRLLAALDGWYLLWLLLFGYSVKIVWDHARKIAKERRSRKWYV